MKMNSKTKPATPVQGQACECGCGTQTKGGKFAMGHDSKHKSTLVHLAMAGEKSSIDELERRGWTRFLDKKREVANRPQAAPRVRQERSLDDEEKAAIAFDRYQSIKAAGERLKSHGRYAGDRKLIITKTNYLRILNLSNSELSRITQTGLDSDEYTGEVAS